jgi:hypothetical protein
MHGLTSEKFEPFISAASSESMFQDMKAKFIRIRGWGRQHLVLFII